MGIKKRLIFASPDLTVDLPNQLITKMNMQRGQLIEDRWRILDVLPTRTDHPTSLVLVVDVTTQNKLAVKTVNRSNPNINQKFVDAFQTEASAWIYLGSHQNIVQAHFIRKIDGLPFLFVEFVDGGDLAWLIDTGALVGDISKVIRFAIQICDALIYSHQRGIVAHADLKPHNCLLTGDEILKLTDFGLSKVIWKTGNRPVRQPLGTLAYMAPEQFSIPGTCDVKTDIYQFGVLLFQMVTGQLPFPVQNHSEMMAAHLESQPPPIDFYSLAYMTLLRNVCQNCQQIVPRALNICDRNY